jgi:2-deoxy-D-gluconate 3-dehydrogenase
MSQKSIAQLFDLTGKTAVVTGGSMGIGYGIVKRLAEAGAAVVIADIEETEGKRKVAELAKAQRQAFFVKTDVSSEADVVSLIRATMSHTGRLDIFVSNAGIYPQTPVLDMDVALWDRIQAVNLRGMFLCNREAARSMVAAGGGIIINIASVDSLHPSMVGLSAYDASKHGVWGFTKNLALEVAKKGVRVNAIAPGGIATEGVEKTMGTASLRENIETFEARIPLGHFGEPDDIATVALFLASDASAYMTGELVVVDGGVLLS